MQTADHTPRGWDWRKHKFVLNVYTRWIHHSSWETSNISAIQQLSRCKAILSYMKTYAKHQRNSWLHFRTKVYLVSISCIQIGSLLGTGYIHIQGAPSSMLLKPQPLYPTYCDSRWGASPRTQSHNLKTAYGQSGSLIHLVILHLIFLYSTHNS